MDRRVARLAMEAGWRSEVPSRLPCRMSPKPAFEPFSRVAERALLQGD